MTPSAMRAALWHQLGAAIDTLEVAMVRCPDELWGASDDPRAVWYLASHTIFFLALYVHGGEEGFEPPPPLGLEELDPAGVPPPRVFDRDELLAALHDARARARAAADGLDGDSAARQCTFAWGTMPYLELLLYAARHTQHHAAQIAFVVRGGADVGIPWVVRARDR